ncbi:alkaline phosphatase PhoX [Actinomadura namibiensis]|uniref:alkaline phosphatase PhoX n=1 Tax=Actinomadura kijaniata TaxID=46161 RepID=UPI0036151565
MSVSRRGVMKGGAAGAVSIALAGSLDTIFQTSAEAAGEAYGYGPLVPDPKGVLDLPRGFSYKVISAQGDALPGGGQVPGKHDGMATFPGAGPGTSGWSATTSRPTRGSSPSRRRRWSTTRPPTGGPRRSSWAVTTRSSPRP